MNEDNNQLAVLRPKGAEVRALSQPVRVLGIDFGTTNSIVTEIGWRADQTEPVKVRCLEVDQPTDSGVYTHFLVPSVVAVSGGRVRVGEGAKRLQARAAELKLERDRSLFVECKNDIGAQRTYHRAPEGFRSPAEVSGKILSFLKAAAEAQDQTPVSRTVVTVPASFQASQRLDTVKAAEFAGINISSGDLLDEPMAAFLDYLILHPREVSRRLQFGQNLVVFDFGGGTCDVAVLRLERGAPDQSVEVSALSVSRYHRLGGGDLDRAIVFEVLLPQILEQNPRTARDLSFEEKKNFIEPACLAVAEALKIGLCKEIHRLERFDQYAEADKSQIVKTQPGLHTCKLADRELRLQSPSLSAEQFETLLRPFLDHDLLYARETEYRLTCSIFAPLQDALERARLKPEDVDLCLTVGGSSLIPQVGKAIAPYFSKAHLLTYQDLDSLQVAVARGAAYNALALALYGRSIFQVVASDEIGIRTATGILPLVERGTSLPTPQHSEWNKHFGLAIQEGSLTKPVLLRIEIVAGKEQRPLFAKTWTIPPPVQRGDKLCLRYRIDANQVFHFQLTLLEDGNGQGFEGTIENPLSNVVNPHARRLRIQKAEEELRTGRVPNAKIADRVTEIARDYAEIQQTEKAISYLKRALRIKNRPDAYLLNLLGIYHGELGDHEKQEKFYREAAANSHDGTALFNLAFAQFRRKRLSEAEATVDEAIERSGDGPTLTLKAQIARALGKPQAVNDALKTAFEEFESKGPAPLTQLNDWELGWYLTACRLAGDKIKLEAATKEQKRRKEAMAEADFPAGQFPMEAQAITPR